MRQGATHSNMNGILPPKFDEVLQVSRDGVTVFHSNV